MSISARIAQHKFEDSIVYPRGIAYAHLLMAFFFFMVPWPAILFTSRFLICASIAASLFFLVKFYDWREPAINGVALLAYTGLFIYELSSLGLPNSSHTVASNSSYLSSKGGMTDMFIGIMPWVYIGIRAAFIIPLVMINFRLKKLNAVTA